MTAAEEAALITTDGVYPDVSHVDYLADPVAGGSLSSTGARRLLPPSCPALFAYEREHGRPDKAVFDFGSAAHQRVLGIGPEIAVIPDDMLASNGAASTKAAKDFVAQARARGAIPITSDVATTVDEMAAALRAHPVASKLLSREYGEPETTLVWTDETTGVRCRARADTLPRKRGGRMILPDYKSAPSAEPGKVAKSLADWAYHQQGDFYARGVKALGLADEVAFLLIVQEKTPPYLVTVVQPDVNAMRIGAVLNRRALDLYAQCSANNHWPSYSEDVALVSLPAYYERQFEEELS